ncbi:MAG TPA: hypothetical protein VH639_25750 [Bryobacteraceae bacterium]|jgi:hypothetical protein
MNRLAVAQTGSPAGISVPDDLSELDQWVVWRYEQRNDKPTKVPYQVGGNRTNQKRARTTDAATWATFEDAVKLWRTAPSGFCGIGFVFTPSDPFCGIDLDDAFDAEGHVKAWAHGIVERFGDTYMEISPSGSGLKIWARGTLPCNLPGVSVGDGQIEIYDHARYFAVTGLAFRGAPLHIEDHAADVRDLYARLTQGRKREWKLQPLRGGRIPCGQQHNMLVSLAGTLRARRVCDEAIEACLQSVNAHQCERPGAPEHISQIVRSSRRWGARS